MWKALADLDTHGILFQVSLAVSLCSWPPTAAQVDNIRYVQSTGF